MATDQWDAPRTACSACSARVRPAPRAAPRAPLCAPRDEDIEGNHIWDFFWDKTQFPEKNNYQLKYGWSSVITKRVPSAHGAYEATHGAERAVHAVRNHPQMSKPLTAVTNQLEVNFDELG